MTSSLISKPKRHRLQIRGISEFEIIDVKTSLVFKCTLKQINFLNYHAKKTFFVVKCKLSFFNLAMSHSLISPSLIREEFISL